MTRKDTARYNKLAEDIEKHTMLKIVEAKQYLGEKSIVVFSSIDDILN